MRWHLGSKKTMQMIKKATPDVESFLPAADYIGYLERFRSEVVLGLSGEVLANKAKLWVSGPVKPENGI